MLGAAAEEPMVTDETPIQPAPTAADFLLGGGVRNVGDYVLENEIARGGMGVVYRARQRSLNRPVAVKMLLGGAFAGIQFLARFRREATSAARLRHPNIVPIFEIGEHEGHAYFSLELVEGGTLTTLLQEGPLPPRRAAELLVALADAVHYAHEQGILHRDLKPSNILLDADGRPRITDFGLASDTAEDISLTATGDVLGTPAYMAPEQATGDETTRGSDVYGLGALLYHTLTGRPPFQAGTNLEVMQQVIENEPTSPRLLNPAVPADLATVCLKCLDKAPLRRYHTALELKEDVGRFLQGEPILAKPISSSERAWKWAKRRPVQTALAGTIAVLTFTLLTGGYTASRLIEQALQSIRPILVRPFRNTERSVSVTPTSSPPDSGSLIASRNLNSNPPMRAPVPNQSPYPALPFATTPLVRTSPLPTVIAPTELPSMRGTNMYQQIVTTVPGANALFFTWPRPGASPPYIQPLPNASDRLSPIAIAHPNGRILFTYKVPTMRFHDLWLINPDGSGLTNLTQTPLINETDACVSPDGSQIAFVVTESKNPGADGIYAMNLDGTNRRQLVKSSAYVRDGIAKPVWTDWRSIGFHGQRTAIGKIPINQVTFKIDWLDTKRPFDFFIVNVDSGAVREYLDRKDGFVDDVSRDFSWFLALESGHQKLITHLSVSSSTSTIIRNFEVDYFLDANPQWSPDQGWIGWSRNLNRNGNSTNCSVGVAVARVDGLDFRLLTTSNEVCFFQSWSPDGNQILFLKLVEWGLRSENFNVESRGDLWLLNLASGTRTNVTTLNGFFPSGIRRLATFIPPPRVAKQNSSP